MSSGPDAEKPGAQSATYPRESLGGEKSYRVVLEDIASGIETTDSFAIKFSLLTKTPLSKIKHVVHRLPATIWSGDGSSRAEHVLALIEEAGGRGKIVEAGGAPPPAFHASPERPARPADTAKGTAECRWCGFPMKEDETRCGFCMTAVGDVEMNEHRPEPRARVRGISRKRLVCYTVFLVVGIMIVEIFTR